MASNTTYGNWMRPIRGGIRNISRPLTMIGFGVLAVTLMLSMANVVAALVFGVVGLGIVMVLAVRDRQHRNVLDRTVERRAHWLPCVPVVPCIVPACCHSKSMVPVCCRGSCTRSRLWRRVTGSAAGLRSSITRIPANTA